MDNYNDFINDFFSAYMNTSNFKDSSMMEIMGRRKEFEENLDNMWRIYMSGNTAQIIEYNNGVYQIKHCGLKVLRNSAGKHKIVSN